MQDATARGSMSIFEGTGRSRGSHPAGRPTSYAPSDSCPTSRQEESSPSINLLLKHSG